MLCEGADGLPHSRCKPSRRCVYIATGMQIPPSYAGTCHSMTIFRSVLSTSHTWCDKDAVEVMPPRVQPCRASRLLPAHMPYPQRMQQSGSHEQLESSPAPECRHLQQSVGSGRQRQRLQATCMLGSVHVRKSCCPKHCMLLSRGHSHFVLCLRHLWTLGLLNYT